ncbi:hypothetical protein H0I23_08550 [Cellulophaga sp. HaHaR_3_176]|uniref:hypothetical protein n=1 Tax=Cellulophaga sp. HaHaR_3_176 TaxID=1942464 RepID=UPI001C20018B|nr:hypothetical protein [Cellulophaga sp. HaHaR_3_176]QWX82527.1 hypothetical protein H0I23_08550 [Cellulophaga sp. HaHaR_3_176]
MIEKKKILTISGSISRNSANLYTLKIIAELGQSSSDLNILDDLNELPHFKTKLTEKKCT